MWFGRKTKTLTTAHGEGKGHRCVQCRLKGAALQKFVWVLPSFTLTGGGRFAGGALYMCCCLLWKRWSEDLEGNGVTVITEGWPLGPQLPSLPIILFRKDLHFLHFFTATSLFTSLYTSDQESSLVDSSSIMRGKVNHLQNVEYDRSLKGNLGSQRNKIGPIKVLSEGWISVISWGATLHSSSATTNRKPTIL